MATEPLRAVRDHLSEVVDRVEREHERVVITRNGHDVAVIISPEDLGQLEETLSVLSDPEALRDVGYLLRSPIVRRRLVIRVAGCRGS
jgi:prevent-host-death family protein